MGNAAAKQPVAPLVEPALDGDLDRIKSLVGAFEAKYILSNDQDSGFPDPKLVAFVNGQDASGNGAMHAAVFKGNLSIAEFLHYCGASLITSNNMGCSPLWLAAGYNHIELVEWLLQHLPEDDTVRKEALMQTNTTGDSPLLAAASRGNLEVCQRLLDLAQEHNVELKGQHNKSLDTPLSVTMAGMEEPSPALVNLLADASIMNEPNSKGLTPLLVACERNWSKSVEALIEKGASLNVRDTTGNSPLAVAAFCGSHDVLELLIKREPALLNEPSPSSGCTPLWLSVRAGHLQCCQTLLDSGADATVPNQEGLTPLDVATKHKRDEFVALLEPH